MANVATHILFPMLLVETYRRYICKTKFSRWYVFFAGLMGAAPDLDLFYTHYMTGSFNLTYHREMTHSLLLALALLLLGAIIWALYSNKILKHKGWKTGYWLLFLAAFGVTCHVLLDGIDGMSRWFYPLGWSIVLPNLIYDKFRAGILDGVLLLVWLLYDEEMFESMLNKAKRILGKKRK
jgi:membrane-bound metal-dependent hydrolase YbcI (DUF457 family)